MTNTPTALLIAGQNNLTQSAALKTIKQIYCSSNNTEPCNNCAACTSINAGTHHAQINIIPEKRYTLEDLELIFKKSSFKLDDDEHCFFIIHKADLLSLSCANTLLKLIEEPPYGYHFIFLTERFLSVLPTIRSRCTLQILRETIATYKGTFLCHFTSTMTNVLTFQKELIDNAPSEEETAMLIDKLLHYFGERFKETLIRNFSLDNTINNQTELLTIENKILFLRKTLLNLPMPGSSKIFWKNFYLKFHLL